MLTGKTVVPETSLLPPLTSQIEPYIEQLAETKAKTAIRKVEQNLKTGNKSTITSIKQTNFQPIAPMSGSSSKNPRNSTLDGSNGARRYTEGSIEAMSSEENYIRPSSPAKAISSPNTRQGTRPSGHQVRYIFPTIVSFI